MSTNVRKFRLALTTLTLVALLLSVFGVVPALAAATWTVDASFPDNTRCNTTILQCKDIQAAIDAASNGDTINVADGTYTITAAITVDKEVTITGNTGSPSSVLVTYAAPQFTNNGFEIGAANITIQGIKVVNCKNGFFFNRNNTTYTGCTITHCAVETASGWGIGEIATPSTTISYNTITDCGDKGIYVRNCESASETTRTEIVGNTLSDCGSTCIQTFGSKYVYIYNNTINATEDKGINVIRSNATGTADRVQVIGNTISETKWPGIQVIGAPYTYVYNNTLTKCNYYGADSTGDWDYASIHVQDDIGPTYSHYTVIDRNTISDGINGIQTWANHVTITNNEIYDMGVAYGNEKIVGSRTYKNSAILVGSNWGSGDIDPTGVVIQHNSIHDNYWGLFYSADLTNGVTAEYNWWGSVYGPQDDTGYTECLAPFEGGWNCGDKNTEPAGQLGDKVSENVDYCPWAQATLWVEPDDGWVEEGQTIIIDVRITANDMNGVEFDLDFDPSLLEVVGVTEGSMWSAHDYSVVQNTYNNTAGTIDFAAYLQEADMDMDVTDGQVARIEFRGLDAGVSDLDLNDAIASTIEGEAIVPVLLEDGTLTVFGHGSVHGVVEVQGRPGDWDGALVTVSGGPGGGYSYNTTVTNLDGTWSISGIVEGDYDVAVEMALYLDGLKTGVSITDAGDTDVGQVKVLGGDCNDSDGVLPCGSGPYGINVLDATIVADEFGNTSPTDPRADINDDNTVNILDAALLGGNWHKCSPVNWP